jgi:hypothetical protein
MPSGIPEISLAKNDTPHLSLGRTKARLLDQGYTYNQATFTYNQAGVDYGGLNNVNQDVVPTFSMIDTRAPSISGYTDIYTVVANPNNQKTVGVGWWMYVSQ